MGEYSYTMTMSKIPVAKNDGYTYNIDEEYCSLV